MNGVSFDGGDPVSTGVGLTNTRDRLVQAYGDQHRFEIIDPPDGGFAVQIEIPFERRDSAAPAELPRQLAATAG